MIEHFHHRDLGTVELLDGRVPTNENLVLSIWTQLAPRLAVGQKLVELTLWQGSERAVSCRG